MLSLIHQFIFSRVLVQRWHFEPSIMHRHVIFPLHSCTHKYNSIKHKILKHLSDLRSSNASHLLLSSYHRTSTPPLELLHTSVKSQRRCTRFSSMLSVIRCRTNQLDIGKCPVCLYHCVAHLLLILHMLLINQCELS